MNMNTGFIDNVDNAPYDSLMCITMKEGGDVFGHGLIVRLRDGRIVLYNELGHNVGYISNGELWRMVDGVMTLECSEDDIILKECE